MARETLQLVPPIGGLNRATAYQSQPPFTYARGVNVCATDVNEGRGRLGARPGLAKAFALQLGSGNPIRLAAAIRSLATAQSVQFTDEFSGSSLSGSWSHPTALNFDGATSTGLPSVNSGRAISEASVLRTAALAGQTPDVALGSSREVSAVVVVPETAVRYVILIVDMNAATPNPNTGGIFAAFTFTQNPLTHTWAPTVILFVNGVQVAQSSTPTETPVPTVPMIRLNVDSANVVRLMAGDVVLLTHPLASYTAAGPRVGFALSSGNLGPTSIESFTFVYTASTAISPPEAAVFSANGLIYREAPAGTLATDTVVGYAGGLASDRRVFAQQYSQQLYIADYGIRLESTGATTNAAGTTFSDADITTGLGISTGEDALEIISGTGVKVGVYSFSAVAAGSLTISPDANTVAGVAASAIKYRVLRWPKVFDSSVNPPTLQRVGMGTIGTSQFPPGCRSVSLWADRLVWCNDGTRGWYMSAAAQPTLYDYGDNAGDGVAAAVAGTKAKFAGLLGDFPVTTIPYTDDLLIFACRSSFYYLRGNPLDGGRFNRVPCDVGIVGIGAWCWTSDGRLIVLTTDGLYEITTDSAIPLSRPLLPRELLGLTEDRYDVSLAYDVARRRVYIAAAGRTTATASVHYFYDLATQGFYLDTHDQQHDPMAMVQYQPNGIATPTVLWGCRDGYVRRIEDAAYGDDGITFAANCFIGPVRLAPNDDLEGVIDECVGTLDQNSGAAMGRVYAGDTAQAALNSAPGLEFIMRAGRNYGENPHLRGNAAYIEILDPPWVAPGLIQPESDATLPTAAALLADLQACTPLPKPHYPFAYVALADSDPLNYEYIRLTRAYGFSVEFTTQAEVNAIMLICKAVNLATPTYLPVTLSLNYAPYADATRFPSTDPRDSGTTETTHLSARLTLIKGWIDAANTANGTSIAVTKILYDFERFNWKPVGYDGTVAAWNSAIDTKCTAVYNIAKGFYAAASVQWFNRGIEETDASATRSPFVASVTGWMEPPWFTGNEPGDAYSCALYALPEVSIMRETMRRSLVYAQSHSGTIVTPWVALAAGLKRWFTAGVFHTFSSDWDYPTAYSAAMGQEINRPFYSTQPLRYAPWGSATSVVFYPQPFQPPAWGKHFLAYVRGAMGLYELEYKPWVLESLAMSREIVGKLRRS